MKYRKIVHARLHKRVNRFIAEVFINGKIEQVHVKNTGRLKELLLPDTEVLLELSDNPARKTRFSLIAAAKNNGWVNVDSQAPNLIAFELLKAGKLAEFGSVNLVKREVTYGDSRFDIYFELNDKKVLHIDKQVLHIDKQGLKCNERGKCNIGSALHNNNGNGLHTNHVQNNNGEGLHINNGKGFIEVKGVTLETNGVAMFPDAPTSRGTKHVLELVKAVQEGYTCTILFIVQMKGCRAFAPNREIDPVFTDALIQASRQGVQILAYDCIVGEDEIVLDEPLPVYLSGEMLE
ncbi:DNA/RNA nuclease SfsA [Calidifontibacillus oryziterrae]|uniref:DNA/RNA nuclease SfsA n=1 Tax=Calidifontibacillus oryziterrae TaxID=1191699 RepID=UPI00036F00B1|nr:DNA/RNA nuclease SfsA [Calidifontibacillus oryziterrae]